MAELGPFMRLAEEFDSVLLRSYWRWAVPDSHVPLLITIFGDWVFGAEDGSHWVLSILDGNYFQVAESAVEFNCKKRSFDWLCENFIAGWQEIADRAGIVPEKDQCIGWVIPPVIGGEFSVQNMRIYPMPVWQLIMGQMLRQLSVASNAQGEGSES